MLNRRGFFGTLVGGLLGAVGLGSREHLVPAVQVRGPECVSSWPATSAANTTTSMTTTTNTAPMMVDVAKDRDYVWDGSSWRVVRIGRHKVVRQLPADWPYPPESEL